MRERKSMKKKWLIYNFAWHANANTGKHYKIALIMKQLIRKSFLGGISSFFLRQHSTYTFWADFLHELVIGSSQYFHNQIELMDV